MNNLKYTSLSKCGLTTALVVNASPCEISFWRAMERRKENRKFNIYKNCHPLCALSLAKDNDGYVPVASPRRHHHPAPGLCIFCVWDSLFPRSSDTLLHPILSCRRPGSWLECFYYINCCLRRTKKGGKQLDHPKTYHGGSLGYRNGWIVVSCKKKKIKVTNEERHCKAKSSQDKKGITSIKKLPMAKKK